ncbi:MAG: asparagine synthase (glutamine-hydrolyzing) [Chloroflexi bacterium]|nr:asparagine synthase (glutamine-hydrolyzing) [Chloroflexota bacterium]
MCGICGVVRSDNAPVETALLKKMNVALAHRGPDGDGYYHNPGVGFAMRRLAVIDVVGGAQPITNEDESLWIVYNGESYNYPTLSADLQKRGHRFRTQTDTECVLHLYEEYGVDCVKHLRGQFAFALWDENTRRLMIARDRLGQKPLYYTMQGGVFFFASELTSLCAGLPQRPAIHLPAIDHFLGLQYIPEPLTPYEGVYKLPAAHRLIWQNGDFHTEAYWDLDYGPKLEGSEDDLAAELRERARQAVEMRLISEVPLGAHLSGGIDSSIVVALMAEISHESVKTFSVGFEESAFSELSYARSVAERYETDHHEFTLSFGDIPATVNTMLTHFGEPFADPSAIPLYHLSRLTREYVTVALNGDGGDEAFAGYLRYRLDPWANRYLKLPSLLTNKLLPAAAGLLPDRADRPVGGSLINGLKRLGQLTTIDPRASILRWGSYFSPDFKKELWKETYHKTLDLQKSERLLIERFSSAPAASYLDRTLYTDNKTYLPGDLLVKADRMTMAHSLEGRSPFLDHEFAGWAARLPEGLKFRGRQGKYLLRKAFASYLPDEITRRGKQGFGIPLGAWFRGPLYEWSREVLLTLGSYTDEWFERPALERILKEHKSGRVDHGKRLWALVVLGLWAEMQPQRIAD